MEDIRIYRTNWENIVAGIISLAFSSVGCVLLFQGKVDVIPILCLLFFGSCSFYSLYLIIKGCKKPYLTITDKSIVVYDCEKPSTFKQWEIPFAEVEHFEVSSFDWFHPLSPWSRTLYAYWKNDQHQQLLYKPSLFWRIITKLFSGPNTEEIPIGGIHMKPILLLELLNERLYKRSSVRGTIS